MKRTRFVLVGMLIVSVMAGSTLAAQDTEQEPEWKTASGSFQGEYAYQIGSELNPRAVIDGLRWNLLSITPKKETQYGPGDVVDVVITLGFENPTAEKFKFTVIILMEDTEGHKVGEPINLKEEKLGRGETKTFEQKIDVAGSALLNTGKIYLLLELH